MRIFKHRGDIYVSKARLRSDVEQRILIAALCFILVFTAVFVIFTAVSNDFSAKKFFKPDNMESIVFEEDEILPQVSGKHNYCFILNNYHTDELYMCALLQVDMDSFSYKACTLDKNTLIDDKTLEEIYNRQGAAGLKDSLGAYLSVNIDYYINESTDSYNDMFNMLGKVNYTLNNEIRYKDISRYGFNIKIKEGEQTLDGDKATKIIRYYAGKEKNFKAVNDILLVSLTQQLNSENFERRERVFSTMIEKSETNITVKDFTENLDNFKVLASETTGFNVYNVEAQYEGKVLTEQSSAEIRAYFSK